MDIVHDGRKKNWFFLENQTVDNENLNIYEKMAYIVLARYADNYEDTAFPSYETIARKMRCSKRKAIEAVKALEEKKLLTKTTRYKNNSRENNSNLYKLLSLNNSLGSAGDSPRSAGDALGGSAGGALGGAGGAPKKDLLKNTNSFKKTYLKDDIVCCTNEQRELIINCWNGLNLQKLIAIKSSTNRYKLLQARIKEHGFENVIAAIRKINESDFLKGQNKTGWTITFDWLVKPNNFLKVLEGNYDNKMDAKIEKQHNQSKQKDNRNEFKTKFHNFKHTTTKYNDDQLKNKLERNRLRKMEELRRKNMEG